MSKSVVLTEKAPQPIGPYSQAVRAGDFLFCSGQIPLDASSGQVASSDVTEQAKKVMENLGSVLTAAGCSWDSVVKSTIFLKSMNDFSKVNEVYGAYFKSTPPARSTIEVSRLPKDVLVEIEVVAYCR
jgi:2-iminobutanoate/2-iminopropanoate deaminase